MSVFLTPIYTQTVGAGGVASVTFNNIPQSFTDLKLVISARSNQLSSAGGYAGIVRLNNVTTNVSGNQIFGDGTAIGSNRWDALYINIGASNYTANTFGTSEVYIPNYTRGTFKQITVDVNSENNATSGPIGQASVSWGNTAPITSMTILPFIGNFIQNSTFTLYGIANIYDTARPAAPTIGAVTDLAGIASVAFTANDSGTGQTAENYSVQDVTIMGSPVYSNNSPVIVPVTTNVTYNNLAVSANNALGSNTSANPAGFTSVNNYASIATINGFGGTFTNIPQYYRHLQIRITGRAATGLATAPFILSINGNSDTAYVWHQFYGNSSTAFAGGLTGQTFMELIYATGQGSSANYYASIIIDILEYTNTTKFKTVRSLGGYDVNASGTVGLSSGYYPTLAPISSIGVSSYAGFDANTTIALYGVG